MEGIEDRLTDLWQDNECLYMYVVSSSSYRDREKKKPLAYGEEFYGTYLKLHCRTDLVANWKLGRNKTKHSSHHISRLDKTDKKLNVFSFNIFCRRRSWLVTNSVQTADTNKTRQFCLVGVGGVTRFKTHFNAVHSSCLKTWLSETLWSIHMILVGSPTEMFLSWTSQKTHTHISRTEPRSNRSTAFTILTNPRLWL